MQHPCFREFICRPPLTRYLYAVRCCGLMLAASEALALMSLFAWQTSTALAYMNNDQVVFVASLYTQIAPHRPLNKKYKSCRQGAAWDSAEGNTQLKAIPTC